MKVLKQQTINCNSTDDQLQFPNNPLQFFGHIFKTQNGRAARPFCPDLPTP